MSVIDHQDEAGLLLTRIGASTLPLVYDRYAAVLYGAALRMTGNADQAATILKNVFIAIQDPGQRYSPDQGRPLMWLLRQVHRAGCALLKHEAVHAANGPATSDRDLHLLVRCYALVQSAPGAAQVADAPLEERVRSTHPTRYSPR